MRRLLGILVAACAAAHAGLAYPIVPVTSDLWDVSTNGATVLNNDWGDPEVAISPLVNMFGAITSNIEPPNAIFKDWLDDSSLGTYVNWLAWRVDTPVAVAHFNLFAFTDALNASANCGSDGVIWCYPRTMSHLNLAYLSGSGWVTMYDADVDVPYAGEDRLQGHSDLFISEDVAMAEAATDFRASFTTSSASSPVWPGVRVVELDAFGGTDVPEPANWPLVAPLLGIALGIRRTGANRGQ